MAFKDYLERDLMSYITPAVARIVVSRYTSAIYADYISERDEEIATLLEWTKEQVERFGIQRHDLESAIFMITEDRRDYGIPSYALDLDKVYEN